MVNEMTNGMVNGMVNESINPMYILLEDKVCYDWDDYGVWGAVLFDLSTKKVVTEKYGHGCDLSCRKECVKLNDAVERGLTSIDELINSMCEQLGFNFNRVDMDTIAACYSIDKPLDIPVKIVRGRKGKGINGRLVYAIRERERYGLGAYRGWYNYRPVVMNIETGELVYPNSMSYLEYDTDFITRFNEAIMQNIPHTINEVYSLAHAWAYGMSYSACDSENYRSLIQKYSGTGIVVGKNISTELQNAIDAYKAEELRKLNERKEQELPKIIEWVKNNTDKQGDDILKLAEHIWNKNHN